VLYQNEETVRKIYQFMIFLCLILNEMQVKAVSLVRSKKVISRKDHMCDSKSDLWRPGLKGLRGLAVWWAAGHVTT
jgi:hypothetical protein